MNKVIVTGGAGFIGSNLVKRLLDDGAEEILIIDDFSTGKKENLHDSSKVHLIAVSYTHLTLPTMIGV